MTKKDLLIVIGGIAILVFAFSVDAQNSPMSALLCKYQCVTCENAAKTESGNELYLPEGQIITNVYVKAGQGCYMPDGGCYATVSGGVGYDYVIVEKLGDGPECQDISHLEVCFEVASTPTFTQTPERTATFTQTPEDPATATPTNTEVDFTQTPSAEPTVTPEATHTWQPTRTQKSGSG